MQNREPASKRCFSNPPNEIESHPCHHDANASSGINIPSRITQPMNHPSSQRPLNAARPISAQAVNADQAAIASAKAAIGASQATAENAKVQLGYTSIYSPIDGRTGNLTVKLGNVVNANSMDMITINQVEPIYVTFSVPEAQLPAIKKYMALGSLAVRSRPQDADTAEEERGAISAV